MYAIWKYDQFPYKLCGRVTKKFKNGLVEIDGYGFNRFKAVAIISDKKGFLIKAMLERESENYRHEQSRVHHECDLRVAMELAKICGL